MLDPKDINWDEIGFSLIPTNSMYVARCQDEKGWQKGELEPFGDITLSPSASVLHYGQGLFEGLKAYRHHENEKIALFRPKDNAQRMIRGCKRLCIPPIPEEIFIDGVEKVARANKDFVPPYKKGAKAQGALYIRPAVWGTGPVLGVAPSSRYAFIVFCSPVGPYFKKGFAPIKLKISTENHRAALGGTGDVKAIGNYACSMLPGQNAKKDGYSEVIYLDAKHDKYVEEVGAANFFCIKGNTLATPSLDGTILPGITRRSILQIAKDVCGLQVEERKIEVDEVLKADEAFASGTAAVVAPIGSICYNDKEYTFNNFEVGKYTQKIYDTLLNIQHGVIEDKYGWIYPV